MFSPLHLRYTYDAMGNILTENRLNPDGSTAESLTYTYDNQFQLTGAVSSVNGAWNYRYDTYGNLRGKDHGSDSVSYTYGDANWLDLLTAVSGTKNGTSFSGSYTYDGAGNPTSYYSIGDLSAWSMTWKNGRELATATNGTHSVSYDYDVNGLRTYKIVDGVRHDYTYASGQLLRESFTQGGTAYTLDFLYDLDGRPYLLYLTKTTGSTTVSAPYYYILNLQGDVIHLVNTSGAAVASYTYDPYGSPLTATGSLAAVNPLRYRGYYYDPETGFYYLQSRYYDPALGRFLNADSYASTGQGFLGYNMFAYCGNNPVNALDYSGHMMVGFGIGTSELYGGGPLSYGSCAMAMPYSSVSSTGSYGSHITMVPMASTGYSALAKTVAVVGTAALVASSIAPAAYPNKKDEEERKHQAYFPENPDLFIPFGLVRNDYPTKRYNGPRELDQGIEKIREHGIMRLTKGRSANHVIQNVHVGIQGEGSY